MECLEQTLGQLARQIPGAARLFDDCRLDFFCAGNRTLRTAAQAAGLDPMPIAAALQALEQRAAGEMDEDWNHVSDTAMVDHIVARFDAVHREQLPELIREAHKVERVHADRADCPRGLAHHLEAMAQALDSHMRKEEQLLFPLIARGQGRLAAVPIEAMRTEHLALGNELRRLAELTQDLTPPRNASTTWRALYAGLRALRHDLIEHIHLENNVLFERFAPAAVH